MRILSRYILWEVLSHALLGGVLFTFILFLQNLGQILDLVVRDSAPMSSVVATFFYTLPNTLTATLPMAVLAGVLLGLSRMAADSEIIAMRAAGIGISTFVRIVGLMGVFACGLGLLNTLYVAPRSAAALLRLEDTLKTSQASFEVQPRVFYEDFHNYVLYVQDVAAGSGAANWRKVFLADLSVPGSPRITTAAEATVVGDKQGGVQMRLRTGAVHEMAEDQPSQYTITTFNETQLPAQFTAQHDVRMGHSDAPILAMPTGELAARSRQTVGPGGTDGRWFAIELQKRLSYPFACIVLMLLAVPLGMSSQRGGKGSGFVLALTLVFVYYFLSSIGIALARQGKVPVFAGVWAANIIFGLAAIILLRQISRGTLRLGPLPFLRRKRATGAESASQTVETPRISVFGGRRFPLLLDTYVVRAFLSSFLVVLGSFVMLMLIFTFFELLGDIIRNRSPLVTVGEYLLNLMPSMVYILTPLAVLIAVVATFGGLERSSELTAMKASGISLYRVAAPVVVIAAMVALTLFAVDNSYLPITNRRQEALRMSIKGKPAQTFLRPDREWIFGEQKPGQPDRIYYYQFFDTDADQFDNLTVFEFNPDTFLLTRRIFAGSTAWDPKLNRWVFTQGWVRTFNGDELGDYQPFEVKTFPELSETPQYFKKEVRQSQEMNVAELRRYTHDLEQSGFDVVRLRVALFHKFAYPLIALVMAILAVPFAMRVGRRSSLAGMATALGVAICYWVLANLSESLGNASVLPPALAAWTPDLLFALIGGYLLLRAPT